MLNIKIAIFHSTHDCETCGFNMSDVVILSGDLGDHEIGDYADCFGSRSGFLSSMAMLAYEKIKVMNDQLPERDFEYFGNLSEIQTIAFFEKINVQLLIEHIDDHDEYEDFEEED